MSSASRAALRRKARSKPAAPSGAWFYFGVAAIVAVFAAVAIFSTGDQTASSDDGAGKFETSAVTVTGPALPSFESAEQDPAVGTPMPGLSGVGFDGRPVSITDDGRAKILLFLAHWCPHCQAEVPIVQSWIDQGGLPADVDLYSVSTAVDENMPNYPPSEWLEREGWTSPALRDDDGSAAGRAAGVSSYPYFVFLNSDGTVALRAAGELSIETIEGALELLER